MTDQGLRTLFLFLHFGAAIIAFGPTFAFPLVGAMARKEPAHTNFAVRINEMLTDRLVIPFALTMAVSGAFLIYFAKWNLADRSGWWLGIGIVLYIIAISIGIFVQRPVVRRMVELTSRPPQGAGPGSAALGSPAPGSPPPSGPPSVPPPSGPPAGPPSGPPPAVREAARQIQRNGSIMGVLIVVIVLLMVAKPQF